MPNRWLILASELQQETLEQRAGRKRAVAAQVKIDLQEPVVQPLKSTAAQMANLRLGFSLLKGGYAGLRNGGAQTEALRMKSRRLGQLAQLPSHRPEDAQRLLALIEQ